MPAKRRSSPGQALSDLGTLLMKTALLGLLLFGGLALMQVRSPGAGATPSGPLPPDITIHDPVHGDLPRLYQISIPSLALEAPIVAISTESTTIDGLQVAQLQVPHAFAVGWDEDSAPIGVPGNSILVGHNNIYGEVFKNLADLQIGETIEIQTASGIRRYTVAQVEIFEEANLSLEARRANARWLSETSDEQLTLISCWPYVSNTHRVVVIALPGL